MRGAHGVGAWKTIRMDWDVLGSTVTFPMGNGRRWTLVVG